MRPARTLAAITALAVLAAACTSGATSDSNGSTSAGGSREGGSAASSSSSAPAPTSAVTSDLGFPTGPALLVAADYQAPKGKVDSTGAFIPANGKPTLVWVDAIW